MGESFTRPRCSRCSTSSTLVGGTEEAPENLWRIVHLTEARDPRLVELFTRLGESPWLPEFVEIYIRRDLHIDLARR